MTTFRKMYIAAFGFTVATGLSGVAAAATCGACGDDAQIETSIKASFQKLPYLGAPNSIQVQTIKHVAYLSGSRGQCQLHEPHCGGDCARNTGRRARVVNTISVTK